MEKTLRHSEYDNVSNPYGAPIIQNRLVLGKLKWMKSNEITAIPELIKMMELSIV